MSNPLTHSVKPLSPDPRGGGADLTKFSLSRSHLSTIRPTSRADLLAQMNRSISIIGAHPIDDVDNLFEDGRFTAVSGIFPGPVKAISTLAAGNHGDNFSEARTFLNKKLSEAGFEELSDRQVETLANNLVSAWPVPSTGGVRIRADVTDTLLVEAIEMLQEIGVPDHAIELRADSQGHFENIKKIGGVHRHKVFSHSEPGQFIADHIVRLHSDSKNMYFYCASRGERLITPDLLLDLNQSLADQTELLNRLDEISSGYKKSHTAKGNNVDFLVFQRDGLLRNFEFDTSPFIEQIRSIRDYVRETTDWGERGQRAARERIANLHTDFCASTNPFFHHDQLDVGNNEWERVMSLVLRGIKDEDELDTLGPEYRGHFEVLPGGRVTTLEPATGSFGVTTRGFVFEKAAASDIRDILNMTLSENPKLEYAYVCEIPVRLTRRAPEFETANFVEEGPHRSLIVVYQNEDSTEEKIHLKRFRWPSHHLEEANNGSDASAPVAVTSKDIFDYVALQHYCLQSLGVKTTGVEMVTLQETTESGELLDVEYYKRAFVNGRPPSHEDLLLTPAGPRNDNPTTSAASAYQAELAQLLGGPMAASNLFMRRQYFASADEIYSAFSDSGAPTEYYLTSPRSAFPAPSEKIPLTPLGDTALYSSKLAADMVAILHSGLGDAEEYKESFLNAFSPAWQKLSDEVPRAAAMISGEIEQRYRERSADNPVVSDCDIRPGWNSAFCGLHACSADQIVVQIAAELPTRVNFYNHILSGISDPAEKSLLLKEASTLLASSFRADKGISQEQLIQIVEADGEFPHLDVPERMRRLHALEFSAWLKRQGIAMEQVITIGKDVLEDSDKSFAQAGTAFVHAIQEVPGLHMHQEDTATGFSAIFDAEDPDQHITMLANRGYLLSGYS